jgi:hypothetical protein
MIHEVNPKAVIGYGPGDTVVFHGASIEQVRWGSNDDPNDCLKEGGEYKVIGAEVHDCHTKIFLEGFEGKKFPSAAFHLKGSGTELRVKEWAAKLNGIEYPADELDKFSKEMAENGIIAAYGASDDLLEFRGAIYDEAGAWEGTEVRLAVYPDGTVKIFNEEENRETFEFNHEEIDRMKTVRAVWGPKSIEASWAIETSISHESFDIMEDGELFCRGVVFHMYDLMEVPF